VVAGHIHSEGFMTNYVIPTSFDVLFRYACKLALDEIYQMGLMEESTTGSTEDETFAELSLYEREFYFCSKAEISAFIRAPPQTEAKTIVSMMPREDGMSQIRIFTYEGTGLKFHIGRIDKGVLEGIWSNLSLELLYLTSDDDERFSIQVKHVTQGVHMYGSFNIRLTAVLFSS